MIRLKFFFISLTILSFVGFTSCGDLLVSSDNGHLDGNWQLRRIDTLNTGAVTEMTDSSIFWAFQGSILQMSHPYAPQLLLRFEHDNDRLRVWDIRLNDREKGDPMVSEMSLIRSFGLNESEENFYVETLDRSKMVLKGKTIRLWFRKF